MPDPLEGVQGIMVTFMSALSLIIASASAFLNIKGIVIMNSDLDFWMKISDTILFASFFAMITPIITRYYMRRKKKIVKYIIDIFEDVKK